MFPSPQSALPLPLRPDLESYKKQAKSLAKACQSQTPDAIRNWTTQWVESLLKHSGIQLTPNLPASVADWIDQVESFATKYLHSQEGRKCSVSGAQFVIARSHGFQSWPKFAAFLQELTSQDSLGNAFESAADAIVAGDIDMIRALLSKHPKLIRMRSSREHRATLLHYVAANGVEGYRQKTPPNIVACTALLLQAEADVNAVCEIYGGATTLQLVASSGHPQRAGVQNELLQLLLDAGANVEWRSATGIAHSAVTASLANGRGEAASFLAARDESLSLEDAAGIGNLDCVASFFAEDGTLKSSATTHQLQRGFLWACEYGHHETVKFLLEHGADLTDQAATGQSCLHRAVIGGHRPVIELLIEHGAPLEALNTYGGTALGQAGWSFVHGDPKIDYISIIQLLIAADAKAEGDWLAWLESQQGPSSEAKARLREVLRRKL